MSLKFYGTLATGFWTNSVIQKLDSNGKIIAAYLFAGPHTNMLGAIRHPFPILEGDLNLSKEVIDGHIDSLIKAQMVFVDESRSWLVVKKYLKYNPFNNPNHAKGGQKTFELIPDNAPIIKHELAKALSEYGGKYLADGFVESVKKWLPPQTLTVPQTVTETVPQTVTQTVTQTVSQTVPQTVAQTVSQTVPQTVTETVSKLVEPPVLPGAARQPAGCGLPSARQTQTVTQTVTETVDSKKSYVSVAVPENVAVPVPASVSVKGAEPTEAGAVTTAEQQQEKLPSFDLIAQEVDPTVERVPLEDGSFFDITSAMVAEFKRAFPDIEIEQELIRLRLWNESKPAQRKTRKGIAAHIQSWLKQANDQLQERRERVTASTGRRGDDPKNLNFARTDYRHGTNRDGTI